MREGFIAEDMDMKEMTQMKDELVRAIREKDAPASFLNEMLDSCVDLLQELTDGLQGTMDIFSALYEKRAEKAGIADKEEGSVEKTEDPCHASDEDGEDDQPSPAQIYPSVVIYHPGDAPWVSTEEALIDIVDISEPHVREIRFKETDFLIAFDEKDIKKICDKYYLTGAAVIYAPDKYDILRPLTCAEIMKIFAVIRHMEEEVLIERALKPAFAVC